MAFEVREIASGLNWRLQDMKLGEALWTELTRKTFLAREEHLRN